MRNKTYKCKTTHYHNTKVKNKQFRMGDMVLKNQRQHTIQKKEVSKP
jgi:hypothetical protein